MIQLHYVPVPVPVPAAAEDCIDLDQVQDQVQEEVVEDQKR
jgi:hypothetical protein